MALNQPLVSVIIPVYNGADFLAGAIAEVQAQNYEPLEIIVVDDGSTDNTRAIAQLFQPSVRYLYQENQGPAAARNYGIRSAQGTILGFLDVDDAWSTDKLRTQVQYLIDHPTVEIVQGLIQQMELVEDRETGKTTFVAVHSPYNYINLGSALYRKSVFETVGLFDESMRYGEDVDWFFRAWENGISKALIHQVGLFYRKHRHNMTEGKRLVEVGFVKIFKKHLDRYRQSGRDVNQTHARGPSISQYIGMPPNSYSV
ncbi:glycosyltransferase family 2 protein [Oscillatoria sp. FACHB-1407]|uniref:glycosyltransferase family 2 protein n=1 Tax=Oscillatoria sp. FACHB-1407 TaxID=2692847 RepID=UPI0016835812|nr:glycosyltransferase family A protein [Oscillatoria sp. FACHB-1407]MBD2459421.1 glycosyltransferase family 2 protein [Oscillatoria sp. FACHB-1407]